MSWQFKEFWAERVTEKEILLVREELKGIIKPNKKVFSYTSHKSIKKPLLDYYGNTNLLLTNPIKEKEDNWDIDIFLIYENEEKQQISNLLRNHKNVSHYNSQNKEVHSFLFQSEKINKKVQIDLNFINWNSSIEINNYFKYFQAPYFFFTLSYLIKTFKEDLNIKISNKWIFIKLQDADILLEKNLNSFLHYLFNIDDLSFFNSYEKIWKFLNNQGFNKSLLEREKVLSNRTKLSTTENEKFWKIISYLNWDLRNVEKVLEKFKENFPFIEDKIKKYEREREKIKIEKESRVKNLEYFYWKPLSELSNEEKVLIGNFWVVHNNLAKLKKMQEIFWEKELFLVGWCVRDILLKKEPNDFDLTGAIHSQEFQKIFWWNINEKYWTVFCEFEWLEVEFTPFRSDEKYDWRQATVSFNATIEEDSERRDFTFNSLYLNLKTGKIIDFHWWVDDLKNKVLKTVWDPNQRFNEDYLRVFRAMRLYIKNWFSIDNKTYEAMVSSKPKLKILSKERIVDELMKWISLNNFQYIEFLENFFWNGLIEKWKNKQNIYTFIKDILEIIYEEKIDLTNKEDFIEFERNLSLSQAKWDKFNSFKAGILIWVREIKNNIELHKLIVDNFQKFIKDWRKSFIKNVVKAYFEKQNKDSKEYIEAIEKMKQEWIVFQKQEIAKYFWSDLSKIIEEAKIEGKEIQDMIYENYTSRFEIFKP